MGILKLIKEKRLFRNMTIEELKVERVTYEKVSTAVILAMIFSFVMFVISFAFGKWFYMDVFSILMIVILICSIIYQIIIFKIDLFIYLKEKGREL